MAAKQDGTGAGESAGGADGVCDPVLALSREARMQLGLQCKALIDSGRLQWLGDAGWSVDLVQYCSAEVSGENKMLLAWRSGGT